MTIQEIKEMAEKAYGSDKDSVGAFIIGAGWAKNKLVNEACHYIRVNASLLDTDNNDCMPKWLEHFKKAMNE